MNIFFSQIVLFLIFICAFCSFGCAIWEAVLGQHFQVYLPWDKFIPKDISTGATFIGFLVFFSYAIVLNTFVPISLYVSVEVSIFYTYFSKFIFLTSGNMRKVNRSRIRNLVPLFEKYLGCFD